MATEKPRKRKTAVPQVQRTVKTSLTVDADLHVRWSAAAAMRGMSNNALAVEILAEALRSIVVFDRAKSPGDVNPSDEVDRVEAA